MVGVVGDDPFGSALDRTLARATVAGHPIEVHRWRHARGIGACYLLFAAASEEEGLDPLLSGLADTPVLTVGDMSEFAVRGGIIGLVLQDDRIRFQINTDSVARAHLRVSSRLLSLARIVSSTRGPRRSALR